MSGKDDADEARRYTAPYSARNPIPTISKYRAERAERQERALNNDLDTNEPGDGITPQHQPSGAEAGADEAQQTTGEDAKPDHDHRQDQTAEDVLVDTTQTGPVGVDAKQRRKAMKKNDDTRERERAEREVTDPVTHLPVTIHDFTDEALKEVAENYPVCGTTQRTATGASGKSKSGDQMETEREEIQQTHDDMKALFPPPSFDALRRDLAIINKRGVTFGLAGAVAIIGSAFTLERLIRVTRILGDQSFMMRNTLSALIAASSAGAVWALVVCVREWMGNKIQNVFQDEVWDAQRKQIIKDAENHDSETTVWLNSLVGAVWPLINPELFASLADTLEDVMQASLPSFVRMVSVEDIGQGSEALRILGIRWLPTGAAAKSVTEDGELSSSKKDSSQSTDASSGSSDSEKSGANGMEAEEGDFINLEVAFAYRTRSSSKSLKERTKDLHLMLAFYLPGNVKLPVWVDLQGLVGVMRLRLQLTPDPPFFALCTLTFLGQPKVNLSCVPLSRHALNIMDVPFISNFVQSAVDAAMAQYVAPKSLTLDLKSMLAGADYRTDNIAVGMLVINVKRGYDFKAGDSGVPLLKAGSSDPYVSVGWAKFGKVLWTTRVLEEEMEPYWNETCYVLVTPEELNIDERIRVQLWDSDRLTADDDLGRIEVSLKKVMTDNESNGRMADRTDGFRALKSGDHMPGKLEWSIGYFSKTRMQADQFEKQTHDTEIRTMAQLKDKVDKSCEKKLREAMFKKGKEGRNDSELEQQKAQELKAQQDAMINSAPPPDGYPSGVFSIQIHNITGLELQRLNKRDANRSEEASDEEETGEGLPSAYCVVIINHRKTFKTRTKPQNAKPFYNAACERFVRDWRDCEVFVVVRDARLHEMDPLIGIVHLPLADLFRETSQVNRFWPLTGGIGFGKIRLSMVWRSVQLQSPRNMLGWQYGTLEIAPTATVANCPKEMRRSKAKFRTTISKGKMYARSSDDGTAAAVWTTARDRSLALAVQSRYNTCLSISWKDKRLFGDDTAAFSVLWLRDLVDEEPTELELPVWKGDMERATANCLEQCGEKLATIKIKVTFWSGLGSAHSSWARKDSNLRDVIEVIETARDNMETDHLQREAGIVKENGERPAAIAPPSIHSNSDSSSSSESDDDDDRRERRKKIPDGSAGNEQGPIDQVRDYRRRDKRLHRQHRGIMQWKIPRTARWLKDRLDRVGENVSGVFEHSSKQPGIETEV